MVFIVGLLLVLLSMVEFSINVAEMKEMFDVLLFVDFSAWSCLAGAKKADRQRNKSGAILGFCLFRVILQALD